MKNEFKQWKIADDIYAIQCPGYLPGPGRLPGWGYVISYLIIGKDRALLQDTGYGNADLKGYIAKLTDKELIIVNSHVHPDHSGGNNQFGEILVLKGEVESENPIYFEQSGDKAPCKEVLEAGEYKFKFIEDGHIFDLGNREVEAIRIEGHTKGSMALLDKKTKLLFSGDAILKRVLMLSGLPLSSYREALVRVDNNYDFIDIYGSHWYEPLGRDFIGKVISLIDSYDPKRTESSPWMDGKEMVVFLHGDKTEDENFCAIGFSSDDWKLMSK